VDEAGRWVATAGLLGRGITAADVELPMPVGNRGNGGCKPPAENCATAADS